VKVHPVTGVPPSSSAATPTASRASRGGVGAAPGGPRPTSLVGPRARTPTPGGPATL
jgi:hypothetical protein